MNIDTSVKFAFFATKPDFAEASIVFLLAAGKSKRFGEDKLFAILNDKPVIFYSLNIFQHSSLVSEIYIAANTSNRAQIAALVKKEKFNKVKKIILGGVSRFESVKKLVVANSAQQSGNFIIHNAANPGITEDEIRRCLKALRPSVSGAGVGRQVLSTLKEVSNGIIKKTISRHNIWEMETPQVVRAKDFNEACRKVAHVRMHAGANFTDDLSVLEAAGFKTVVSKASPYNRKITTSRDLQLIPQYSTLIPQYSLVGIGEDSHKFSEQRMVNGKKPKKCLVIGGMKIRNMPPLAADSDGDVILHALCNAIASALGKGSLGTYATAMAKRGICDSKKYLEEILVKMNVAKRGIYNCAISIEAARPRIDPFVPKFKKSLSKILKIPKDRIGITATSGEKLTSFGRGKAIRCQAAVLLI